MLKTFLIIVCCLFASFCFSQTANKDSSLKTIYIEPSAKDSGLLDNAKTSLKVYPNPAKNKISIVVTGFEPGMVVVKIIDSKGKICRIDNRLLTDGNEEIPMFLLLKPGIYFISVTEKNKSSKKRLIIF